MPVKFSQPQVGQSAYFLKYSVYNNMKYLNDKINHLLSKWYPSVFHVNHAVCVCAALPM